VNIFGFNISLQSKAATIDEVLRRLEAVVETAAGITVTPENCEESPTVHAIVNAISMHIATLPIHVQQKSMNGAREVRQQLPNHPVAKLLSRPNEYQTESDYWLDASSILVRHGRYFALLGRGITGPIRRLLPVHPNQVQLSQARDFTVTARVTDLNGAQRDVPMRELHHVRNRASDFVNGDSPVLKARDSIALEIAAQRFGSEFFGNGAMPGLVFKYADNYRGHLSKEQRDAFVESVQQAYGRKKRFRALLLPNGIGSADTIKVENDKAQFLETRKLQRNIIAGVFGVPPHLVGDLERGTFSNIEHQSAEFQQKVILPYVRTFENAMERDLLTDDDRRSGVVIRFNLDANLRADFMSRQKGLSIQRLAGVICPNDWREREGMNPIPADDGGETYWMQGPSGQGATDPNEDPKEADQNADAAT
jgi:HK97 family phage portal protein